MTDYVKTDYEKVQSLADNDVETLMDKGHQYGDSWRRRGGVGAFMMLARKWDRIEKAAEDKNWDIFTALAADFDGLSDDIGDLRRYLLLVEEHASEVKNNLNKVASVPDQNDQLP